MATVPAWWQQGATQINPLEQTWGADGNQSERFGMNNYDAILKQLGIGNLWTGGAPDDSSQGAFRAQDVQDWLSQNGYQLMANQGVGAGGGADTYQNLNWIQDQAGNMVGDPTFNRDDPNGVLKMAALAAAGYFGGGALAGAGEGAGAAGAAAGGADAATSAAWANGAGLGMDTVGAVGGGSAAGAGSLAPLAGIEGMGVNVAPTMTNTALGTTSALSPELAAAAAGGSLAGAGGAGAGAAAAAASSSPLWDQFVNRLGDAASNPSTIGGLLGAAAGIADANANNKPTTSTKDPWAQAVPFLQQQLQQGRDLSARYAAQPFSQAQQTAYGNLGGLLDSINGGGMQGLLSGMGANASGANQYSRANPGRQLTGGAASLPMWQPGLLGNFGTKG